MTVLIADFCQVSILIIVVCDPVVDASVLLPVMLRRDTVTEVILPVDLVTGWQLDAGNVTISVIGIDSKCMLTTKRKNILNYFNIRIFIQHFFFKSHSTKIPFIPLIFLITHFIVKRFIHHMFFI